MSIIATLKSKVFDLRLVYVYDTMSVIDTTYDLHSLNTLSTLTQHAAKIQNIDSY